jgi:FkbM family methyltransferase
VASIVGKDGKVISIEPVFYNFVALLHGIKVNQLTNVTALNIALWNEECSLPLYIGQLDRHATSAGLLGLDGSSSKRKIGKKVYVVAKTLDDVVKELDLNHVDWIKIDVEGSEREVLMGSRDTIRKYTPKIVAECTINVEETLAFMKSLGYSYAKIHQNYFYFKPM